MSGMTPETVLSPEEFVTRARHAGLSTRSLCKRAGISVSTFIRWQAGKTVLNLETYKRLIGAIHGAEAEVAGMRRRFSRIEKLVGAGGYAAHHD